MSVNRLGETYAYGDLYTCMGGNSVGFPQGNKEASPIPPGLTQSRYQSIPCQRTMLESGSYTIALLSPIIKPNFLFPQVKSLLPLNHLLQDQPPVHHQSKRSARTTWWEPASGLYPLHIGFALQTYYEPCPIPTSLRRKASRPPLVSLEVSKMCMQKSLSFFFLVGRCHETA